MDSLATLRSSLVAHSLFAPTTLRRAIDRLGFLQADPIRSPARCQDLILRHRVKNYQAGDLEIQYPSLDLEEDFTFAYGFLPRENQQLLHPRSNYTLSLIEKKVVAFVKKAGPTHPSEMNKHCDNQSVRNAWGGQSRVAKQALDDAHHYGFLRVSHREKGIRVYESAKPFDQILTPEERFKRLLLLHLSLFGPTTERFLMSETGQYKYLVAKPTERKKHLHNMIEEGVISSRSIDGVNYLSLHSRSKKPQKTKTVKLLAPFDPIVRDRDRFEHLWGWNYRFEAYTPPAKRTRGYYALPLLWGDDVLGWVNAKIVDRHLNIEIGYERIPKNRRAYERALKNELNAFAQFLHLDSEAWTICE